jgi:rhamnulose-1-phosphate aldolase/alcohol dehydrogenase
LKNQWGTGTPSSADALDQIVHLSNLVGTEDALVQPGGGNTSIKIDDPDGGGDTHLLVKGSGTDLRTIGRRGFTRLSMTRLAELSGRTTMSDEAMMRFLAECMLDPDQPMPSVETPLHSILPYRVIVHTHDIATMSLTNISEAKARALVGELFGGTMHFVPYVRPGFPLAESVIRELDAIPNEAIGLILAHHGLVVWGDTVEECYTRLHDVVNRIEAHIASLDRASTVLGPAVVPAPPAEARRKLASVLLPAIRGALSEDERVILHFDDSEAVLTRLGSERFGELSQRGMTTPEHILRAGRLPIWLPLDLGAPEATLVDEARTRITDARADYLAYHQRHADQQTPLTDWAKVLLVPGLGMVTAFKDKKSARTANACYRAGMASIENAEAIDAFEFIPEHDVFEFEHWPLERRKIEESIKRERETLLVARHVVIIIGGGSGIGRAAAERFAGEGATVVIADLDKASAIRAAEEIALAAPMKTLGVSADVTDEASLRALFETTVLEFGGIDSLFYAAGAPPRFAEIAAVERSDLVRQLEVHYLGAVLAMREAATVMQRQGIGGSIVASVSKAAVAPGREAVAYGGSKAALLQAVRVAAVELGRHQIRVNAINADQVETPLFLRFVAERAAAKGISVAEQLALYRERNVMHASLIPPEAVGDLAVLLASDKFRYTTGDILTIDGGLPEAFPR